MTQNTYKMCFIPRGPFLDLGVDITITSCADSVDEFINNLPEKILKRIKKINWIELQSNGKFDRSIDVSKYNHAIKTRPRKEFSKTLRWKVMERDGFRCVKCGRSAADGIVLEVDHEYPRARGGMATMENGQTLCFDCNRGKGAHVSATHTTLHIN